MLMLLLFGRTGLVFPPLFLKKPRRRSTRAYDDSDAMHGERGTAEGEGGGTGCKTSPSRFRRIASWSRWVPDYACFL